jgi:CO/xanthine dehydrogenase Mo-binding subunit
MDGGAPAIAAAIEHALSKDVKLPKGTHALLPDLPLLPEKIFDRVRSLESA